MIARRPENGMSRLCSAHWIAAISHLPTTVQPPSTVMVPYRSPHPRLAPRAPAVGPCDAGGVGKTVISALTLKRCAMWRDSCIIVSTRSGAEALLTVQSFFFHSCCRHTELQACSSAASDNICNY